MTVKKDIVRRFLFEHANVRGQLVALDSSYRTVMAQHAYPLPIQKRLGEMLVASVLLTSALKFQGRLTLQVQSDGPVELLIAKCNHDLHIRALAQWDLMASTASLAAALGEGQLAITVDPDASVRPYQSIVPLNGHTMASSIEHYFSQSEQIPTRLWLVAGKDQAAGLLLQRMPGADSEEDAVFWEHVTTLAATITHQELTTLDHEEILKRLFVEEDVRLFEAHTVAFRCRCSHEEMCNAVLTMGLDDALSVFDEMQSLVVTCEYCNSEYSFSRGEVEQIYLKAEQGDDEDKPTLH